MGVDPAVKAVAQTEMERGERGVALLVLVHVPPGGGRCQADEVYDPRAAESNVHLHHFCVGGLDHVRFN